MLDDAHNLSDEALTVLNLLLDLETFSTPLLTFVLAGDSSLETRLQQPALLDFQKQLDLHLRLHSLQSEEVDSYIAYRVRTAGNTAQDLFSPAAVQRIAHYSKGVPRLINLFCDNALQAAHLAGARAVSAGLVDKVAQEFFFADETESSTAPRQVPVVILPHQQSTPQPKTYPVVLKQGARQLAWLTLALLMAWVLLFQPIQPPQWTHDKASPSSARLAATPAAPAKQPDQPLQPGTDADPLPVVSPTEQPQESRMAKTVPAPERALEPREHRLAETPAAAAIQRSHEPAPALALARRQPSSGSTPLLSNRANAFATNSSSATERTARQKAAHLQLARLGITATQTALLNSVERGDLQSTRLLLTAGVSPHAKNDQGWTPLMFAARGGRQDFARLLIAHGAHVNAKTKTGGTALMLAAMNNHGTLVETLINRGAHVNAKNSQGWTALTYASWKGHYQIVTILLDKGANAQVKDNQGWTPLRYAAWRQETRSTQEQLHQEIAEALGVNLKDEPLAVVANSDYSGVSNLLSARRKTPWS
jgi:ankyrin repeat protein